MFFAALVSVTIQDFAHGIRSEVIRASFQLPKQSVTIQILRGSTVCLTFGVAWDELLMNGDELLMNCDELLIQNAIVA